MMAVKWKPLLSAVPCVLFFSTLFPLNGAKFPNVYPRVKLDARPNDSAGDPLMLTPFLKNESIALAQELSRVSLTETLGIESHAGFFTVDEKFNSNMYFWYFPPLSKNEAAPVLLWLQGGPGASSLFGLFTEVGPLVAGKDGFTKREHHWAKNYHLIFIDNPVGTGFSFTDKDEGYCTDETCIAKGLFAAMDQFFTLFPNLRANDFYIAGESYAGKYIPAFGLYVHNLNQESKRINLKGMAIGNGYCDPLHQLDYGDYLYQHGLIDDNQLKTFLKYQLEISTRIKNGEYSTAAYLLDELFDGEMTKNSMFKTYTGFENSYNFLVSKEEDDMTIYADLLKDDTVRRGVHVGGLAFNDGLQVLTNLVDDLTRSAAPLLAKLLSHYPIMFYSGQLDIIVAYPLTEKFLANLNFSAVIEYKFAPRNIWRVDGDVAGYVRKAGNLTEVLVRNAGHMVPRDQPKWAFELITQFINKIL
ncbi:vitellogenic carboxypeptidase-like [Bombyx mandarina]|uniref:Carboxypeptidase n=1 Tax=Bombyx mandarina TaxID=7092 RepID=A0A6J2JLQ2_BOMMA|nr:vitellogenic carboxypeptidase-like [Bombyx mandarina]